jgi:hypothetical protein
MRYCPTYVSYNLSVMSEVAATAALAAIGTTTTAAAETSANSGSSNDSSVSSAVVVHGSAGTAAAAVAADEPVVYTTTVETWLISCVLAPAGARELAINEFKPLVSNTLSAQQLHQVAVAG